MRELKWLNSSVDDLVRLRSFLKTESPNTITRVVKLIQESVKKLIDSPEIGKPVMNLIDYRDLYIRFGAGGYILRYRIHHNVIYIVHIRHYRELDFKISKPSDLVMSEG